MSTYSLTPEQVSALKIAIALHKSMTEDTITDYGDLEGHKTEVAEMKQQLSTLQEVLSSLDTPSIPTLEELNKLTASQNCLIMLRVLFTSDLSFHHCLYKSATLRNIEEESSMILAMDIEHREADSGLSPEEITEYNEYCTQLRRFADEHQNDPD